MLIMEEELVPNKSYAGFVLGEDIHKYLGSNRIYDIQIIDGTIKVKNYVFYDPEISIDTICSKIQNIDCEKTCYWQGKNLRQCLEKLLRAMVLNFFMEDGTKKVMTVLLFLNYNAQITLYYII